MLETVQATFVLRKRREDREVTERDAEDKCTVYRTTYGAHIGRINIDRCRGGKVDAKNVEEGLLGQ